jgi:hypothetical protein
MLSIAKARIYSGQTIFSRLQSSLTPSNPSTTAAAAAAAAAARAALGCSPWKPGKAVTIHDVPTMSQPDIE